MESIIKSSIKFSNGGTISDNMISINDASTFEVMVKGNEIFKTIAEKIKNAEFEILIQTFAWERNIVGVKWIREALIEVAERKAQEEKPIILKVFIQIDERGPIANFAFSGKKYVDWKLDAKSIGLFEKEGLVEVYVSTYYHDSIASNHAKTIIIDQKTLIITGANFQSSNFHHIPAHDAGYLINGGCALSARKDFVYMWKKRKNMLETPNITEDIENTNQLIQFNDYKNKIYILMTTRPPQIIRSINFLDNPQNCAIAKLIMNAKQIIKIATPNLNAPFVVDLLINYVNNGGKLKLMLGHSFNEKRESIIFLGGTNQHIINVFHEKIKKEFISNLEIKWFSIDGIKPIIGNVAGACHLKFMSVDNTFLMVGNANLDIASTTHLHEVNIILNSKKITKYVTNKIFKNEFKRSIKANPSSNNLERLKHSLGIRGLQENLAPKYIVKILDIIEEENEYKTFKLSKPENFVFLSGQYVNVRSGSRLSSITINPVQLAISSGNNKNYIELTARSSMLAWHPNHCLDKKISDFIEIEGPLGTFFPVNNYDYLSDKSLLLIGGGSGITPLRSVMKSIMKNLPETTPLKLLYSAKYYNDLLYKKDISKWINDGHIICLTRETKNYDKFEYMRVTKILDRLVLNGNEVAFLCGSTELVKDVRDVLINKNVNPLNIFASLPVGALRGGPVYRGDHPTFNS